ncbi:MAG: ATP-binding protein [bacterium]|nr:ATP-binding protein [bacterium]
MNLFALSGLLAGITSSVMAVLMFVKGKNRLHYIWGIFCISVAFWGFGGYKIATTHDIAEADFWWRFTHIGIIFIPVLFTHFIYRFLKISNKWLIGSVYAAGFIFLAANFINGLFIANMRWVFGQFYYDSPPGPFYIPFTAMFFGLVIFSHFKLWWAYRTANGIAKTQIKYFFIGMGVSFAGGSLSFLPVYKIDLYPFFNLAVFLYPIIVGYTILKYRLMDIRVVARRIFLYFGVAAFAYGIFYLVAWIYSRFLGGIFSTAGYLAGLIIAPLFVLGFFATNKWLQKVANRYFFASLYNYQETITKLTDELNHYIDLKKIVNLIVDTIQKTMQLERAGVLLIEPNTAPTRYQIAKVIGFNEQNGISLVQDSALTKQLQKSQHPLVRDELILLSNDAKTKKNRENFKRLHDNMEHIEASLCLPLMSGAKLIGIIVLGGKNSGDAYTAEDLELLNTLSKQAGIAIENARLYRTVQDFTKTLQQKVDEKTKDLRQTNAELTEKNQLNQELLAMKSDFLRVVNHQLNTPLSIMNGYFAMVQEGGFDFQKGNSSIKDGLERLNSTVADFWTAYELEGERMRLTPAETDIASIIEWLVPEKRQMKLARERKLSIEIKKPAFKIPIVWCEAKQITHATSSLLDNAVYYTEKGGVAVSYKLTGENREFLQINIKDTGAGIAKEDKEKLFQKFSRGQHATNLRPDGSGLGLYIAKKIINGTGGKIWVESYGAGKGSTFSFTIPIYKNQQPENTENRISRQNKIEIF